MLYQSDKNNSKQESEKAENDLKQKKFELLHQIEEEKKLNKQSSDIEKEISLVQSEIFSKKENLSDVQKVIQKNKNILNDLNEEEKYKESASKQVREIISAKQNGRLKGIIGRLGDLGSIDSEYDIAVSSATNMLDFIVVEKVVNGEDLVSFIREKNLGKINVIILEKIQNLNFSNFSTPDPRALRLFDLIKVFDSRIKNAFYLALQNTLVTKTLEEARNIAFNSTKR